MEGGRGQEGEQESQDQPGQAEEQGPASGGVGPRSEHRGELQLGHGEVCKNTEDHSNGFSYILKNGRIVSMKGRCSQCPLMDAHYLDKILERCIYNS